MLPQSKNTELKEEIPVLNDKFYGTDEYLQLITNTNKNNARWVYSSLNITDQDDDDNDGTANTFEPSTNTESHPYFDDIKQSFALFNDWQQWPEYDQESQQDNAWKFHSNINGVTISLSKDSRITKSEMLFPFSTPIIAGIFCNNEHYTAIDESILSTKILDEFDNNSYSVYVRCGRPFPFSSNRDLLMIRFCYVFDNGAFIFGEKSINDDTLTTEAAVDGTPFIRAEGVNIWYIKPVGLQSNHSIITHYCWYNPNGAFSKYFQQKIIMDKGKYLIKLYDYMNQIRMILHTEGQLFIPLVLFDLLDINPESLIHNDIGENKESKIVDLNLAVASVVCDVRDFFNGIGNKRD